MLARSVRLFKGKKSLNNFQHSALTLCHQSVTLSHANFHCRFRSKRREGDTSRHKVVRALVVMAIGAGVLVAGAVGYLLFKTAMFGLGSRGETYQVVYEIDLPMWLRELAKNQDEKFETIMREHETVWCMEIFDHQTRQPPDHAAIGGCHRCRPRRANSRKNRTAGIQVGDGTALIEGKMSAVEAKDLAILLRAGAFRVPMKVVEARAMENSVKR